MIKVCHVTSAHPKEDVRIYHKECVSLANAGYDVTLVQQGESYENAGVHLVGFGPIASNRLKRMLFTARSAYKKALEVDADVYHLHDPELLPYGLKLKRRGKKVIFDSHEDVPADILEKYWLPEALRKCISKMYGSYENHCLSKIDGVIGVTPTLCTRLEQASANSAMVTNYPIWKDDLPVPKFSRHAVAFPGLISKIWSIDTLLDAISGLDGITLELRSRTIEEPYGTELRKHPAWPQVNFPGSVPHRQVLELLSECICGVALLQKCPNSGYEMGTLGNTKIFEYMMAGIPVICTNFVLWKQIVEKWHCGICVDPTDALQIQDAIRWLLDHPEEAKQMGENGRKAVETEYNWHQEEHILLDFYQSVTVVRNINHE